MRSAKMRSASSWFTEALARMPDCYQANARTQPVAAAAPPRLSLGLPADGFVFCCFNKTSKLQPSVFDAWMRILGRVPGSVLWLVPIPYQGKSQRPESRGQHTTSPSTEIAQVP